MLEEAARTPTPPGYETGEPRVCDYFVPWDTIPLVQYVTYISKYFYSVTVILIHDPFLNFTIYSTLIVNLEIGVSLSRPVQPL